MSIKSILFAVALLCVSAPSHADDSLYQELGGQAGISQLMETFVLEIASDDRIIHHFEKTDIERLHRLLTEQVCVIAGGPCEYTGEDMVTVHTGMNITRAEFNALVEDLMTAMEQEEVPVTTQNRLLAALAEMHPEVVGL
ncbi:group I truncated hemoglobin [Pseudidiomarina aestuarii]|uniref:group I truncated hemoglobin n=1 Tax=Pseudidiomarina aestuarii TaxID=624146 RepID=UPI003A9865C9